MNFQKSNCLHTYKCDTPQVTYVFFKHNKNVENYLKYTKGYILKNVNLKHNIYIMYIMTNTLNTFTCVKIIISLVKWLIWLFLLLILKINLKKLNKRLCEWWAFLVTFFKLTLDNWSALLCMYSYFNGLQWIEIITL